MAWRKSFDGYPPFIDLHSRLSVLSVPRYSMTPNLKTWNDSSLSFPACPGSGWVETFKLSPGGLHGIAASHHLIALKEDVDFHRHPEAQEEVAQLPSQLRHDAPDAEHREVPARDSASSASSRSSACKAPPETRSKWML